MKWTDGSNYEGDWVRGIQHGKGKMSFPDGSVKQGDFENNIFNDGTSQGGKRKNSPSNKNFTKSMTNLSERRPSKFDKVGPLKMKGGTKSSTNFNNTGAVKKHLVMRDRSNSSRDRITGTQLDNSNPNTGYINGNGSHSNMPAAVIYKPGKSKKRGSDANNSSFGDTSESPKLNQENKYMLGLMTNGETSSNHKYKNNRNAKDELINYTSHQPSTKKLPHNSKLEPLFTQTNGGAKKKSKSKKQISPESRSHYGKFPGKVKKKMESIKNSRGGSGEGSRRSGSNTRLSPLPTKPRKKLPKPK
jgi:hypothetical protein